MARDPQLQQVGPQHASPDVGSDRAFLVADVGFTARMKALMNLPSMSLVNRSASRPLPARNAAASSALYTRVASTSTRRKPASASKSQYSISSSAPATHPIHSSMLR